MKNYVMSLISIGFCMTSDSAELARVTDVLGLRPTKVRKRDEWPPATIDAGLSHDIWEIDTPQVASKCVDTELDRLQLTGQIF